MTTSHRGGRFRDVIAWQKAYELSRRVYELAGGFPVDQRFSLLQQIQRAAVSVPSNIAEGWGRGSTRDYVRFLGVARGSLYELQTQLWLAADLGYIDKTSTVYDLMEEVERILNALIRKLRDSEHTS